MEKYANSVLSALEWFTEIDGSVIASDKLQNIKWNDGVAVEGGVEPEVEDVVRNTGM